MYLSSTADLSDFIDLARTHGRLGLDAEFIQERTFYPRLALVQLAAADRCAMVDPLAVSDLAPLESAIADDSVTKVLHAGSQDLKIFFDRSGVLPRQVFDTQIAAAMAGMGDQIGFGPLVELLAGVKLAKAESFTDWLQRPLTAAQEQYALDDVRYLFALHDALDMRLEELGRGAYAREEFARYEQRGFYVPDPAELFRKVKRYSHLDPRGQAVLRELASWRQEAAQAENKPRGWVVADEVLVEIARRRTVDVGALEKIRAIRPQTVRQFGAAIIGAVQRGLLAPGEMLPGADRRPRLDPAAGLAADLLNVVMKSACQAASISTSMVGTTADVQELVRAHASNEQGHVSSNPIMQGWRGKLVGETLMAFLEGRQTVRVAPDSLALEFTDAAN